jgi:ADP-ribose pyrophosphatase YjhB (NUDIX family)
VCGRPFFENSKPCAGVLVVSDGVVLLGRRRFAPYRGWWDIPGGFMHPGEEPEEAARREILEETGLEVRLERLLGIWMDRYGSGPDAAHTMNFYYIGTPIGGRLVPRDDVSALEWFGPEEIPRRIAFSHARLVLEAWRRGKPSQRLLYT